jgi:hypothetical protein
MGQRIYFRQCLVCAANKSANHIAFFMSKQYCKSCLADAASGEPLLTDRKALLEFVCATPGVNGTYEKLNYEAIEFLRCNTNFPTLKGTMLSQLRVAVASAVGSAGTVTLLEQKIVVQIHGEKAAPVPSVASVDAALVPKGVAAVPAAKMLTASQRRVLDVRGIATVAKLAMKMLSAARGTVHRVLFADLHAGLGVEHDEMQAIATAAIAMADRRVDAKTPYRVQDEALFLQWQVMPHAKVKDAAELLRVSGHEAVAVADNAPEAEAGTGGAKRERCDEDGGDDAAVAAVKPRRVRRLAARPPRV